MLLPQQWKLYALGLAAGILGFVVAFGLWHLWIDHQSLHQIIGILNAQAAAAQKAAGK